MEGIHVRVHGSTDETVELTLGKNPSLKVMAHFEELIINPDPAAVEELIVALKALRLDVAPMDSLSGLDGFTYTLRLIHGSASSEYSWWSEPPSGWRPLARIARQLIALTGRRSPSTGY